MKIHLAVAASGLLTAVAFNAAVDPWDRLRPGPFGLEDGWPAGRVLVTPANFNERAFAIERARSVPLPDVLVLGNSHASQLDERMFPGARLFNGWISSSYLVDAVLVRETLRRRGARPGRLILVVEPKTLQRGENRYDGLNAMHAYRAFVARSLPGREGVVERARSARRQISAAAHELSAQANWGRLKESVAALRERAAGPAFFFAAESERAADRPARRFDGSMLYPASRVRTPAQEHAVLAAECAAAQRPYEADPTELKILKALVAQAREEGAAAAVLIMPVRGANLRACMEAAPHAEKWRRFRASLDGLPICDRLDPATAGCSDAEFLDGDHPDRDCSAKVVASCGLDGAVMRRRP